MSYKNLLFDLDGTLTDPGEGITNSVAYALRKFDIVVTDKTELFSFIGPPLITSFMEQFGFSKKKAELAVQYYREYFRDRGLFENEPYEGIYDTLARLKAQGYRLFIATSKPEEFARRITDHFGLTPFFEYVAGASFDEHRSEKWDVIRYALDTCHLAPEECVMIGDRFHDVVGAQKTGMNSIGVLWGYGSQEELSSAGATHLAAAQSDLLTLLTQ